MVLSLPPTSLVVFVDETGDELFADPRHPVFGFGGSAVMAPYLDVLIRNPWRQVRNIIAGTPDGQLHASRLRNPPVEHIEVLVHFFQTWAFARFAVTCSLHTAKPPSMETCCYVLNCLKMRITDIVRWTPAQSVHLIFEGNERLEKKDREMVWRLWAARGWPSYSVRVLFYAKRCCRTGVGGGRLHHARVWQTGETRGGRENWVRTRLRGSVPRHRPSTVELHICDRGQGFLRSDGHRMTDQ